VEVEVGMVELGSVCRGKEGEEKIGTEDLEVEVEVEVRRGEERRWNVGDVAVKVRKRGGGMN
jgi:hypothetical protein